jgi:predicted metal-dependent hydrolase
MIFNKPLPKSVVINKLGDDILVSVRRSNKAKRISIKIKNQKAELVLPSKNIEQAYDFLLAKEEWVRKKLSIEPKAFNLKPNIIPYFGKDYILQHIKSPSSKIQIDDDIIQVYSAIDSKEKLLLQFCKNKLLIEVTKITDTLGQQENLLFSKIKISNNKRSWGSCSNNGVLSFNWRLIFVPYEVLYYVVVHEMCHLLEMNHSERFWSLVSDLCPDYKIHKLWLKENGLRLYQYLKN